MEIIRRVNSETLVLEELKSFLGKRVKINIELAEDEVTGKKKTKSLGRYKLGKKLDSLNIRDYAHNG